MSMMLAQIVASLVAGAHRRGPPTPARTWGRGIASGVDASTKVIPIPHIGSDNPLGSCEFREM
jgi:hypothetical protein